MTEKQKNALNETIAALPDEYQKIFREAAEYTASLGYMPVKKGTKWTYTDFVKSKVNRTILKIDFNATPPRLGMKFFAIPEYTGIFEKAIKGALEYYAKLKYEIKPHCTGCMQRRNGRCKEPQGYIISLPDGKQGFICGFGIITIPSFAAENVSKIKEALKIQDEFFMREISA